MDNKFEINENFDSEMEMYKLLAKIKDADVYSDFGMFFERVLDLYGKRFGYDDHLNESKVDDIASELVDCINHIIATDKRFEKLFDVINSECEQLIVCGMILSVIRPMEVEE